MKRHYFGKLLAGMTIAASMVSSAAMADDMRIALVVKALGIGFLKLLRKALKKRRGVGRCGSYLYRPNRHNG